MNYCISDFSLNGEQTGIFFYGQQIFLKKDDPDMNLLRSYLFKLIISPIKKIITKEDFFNRRQQKFLDEKFQIVHTCRLSELLKQKVVKHPFNDKDSFVDTYIDYDELLKKHYPDLLKYLVGRLERLVGEFVPNPVLTNLDGRDAEFLAFTEESADNWGGPFELNGKMGCGAIVGENKRPVNIDIFDYSYYSCSDKVRQELDIIAKENDAKNGDSLIYNWNTKDKLDYFRKLPIPEQIHILKGEIGWKCEKSHLESFRPYKLYLYGTDDCSYTKYFNTKDSVEQELIYLRKMQPLDFTKDILARGYFFTN